MLFVIYEIIVKFNLPIIPKPAGTKSASNCDSYEFICSTFASLITEILHEDMLQVEAILLRGLSVQSCTVLRMVLCCTA